MSEAGFIVKAACPERQPIRRAGVLTEAYGYDGLAPLKSLQSAIDKASADLIVPCDDVTVQHLRELYRRSFVYNGAGGPVRALIERSLGGAASFPIVSSRSQFIRLAKEEGIKAPCTAVINGRESLKQWVDENGLPAVLKSDGSSGGMGVRIVKTFEEAERAFAELQAPPLAARAIKWALVDHDMTLIAPAVRRRTSVVNGQAYVRGMEATSTIACWQGDVLAALHFEVLKKAHPNGHSTVLRRIEDKSMDSAAQRMIQRLSLSGIYGFDFMRESDTGNAWLIEINPRTTQVGHLTLGPGRDIPAALYAAVSGTSVRPAPTVTDKDTIALFPQEFQRDPSSPFLKSGFHDVPSNVPALVSACVEKDWRQRAWQLLERGARRYRNPRAQICDCPAETWISTGQIAEKRQSH